MPIGAYTSFEPAGQNAVDIQNIMRSLFRIAVICASASALTIFGQQPENAKDLYDRGIQLLRERRSEQALEAFRRSAQLDPSYPGTHANIGTALTNLGRIEESIAPFRDAVRLVPNAGVFRIGLCQSLSILKKHPEAITECQAAVRLSPDVADAHAALILALLEADRPSSEVMSIVMPAVRKFPENIEIQIAAAQAYKLHGLVSDAIRNYELVASRNPSSLEFQIELAELYLRQERDAEAIAAAEKALELDPKNGLAHYWVGRIYFELGQHDEAAASLRNAASLSPSLFEASYYLGITESRRGRIPDAVAALRNAIRISPSNFESLEELGRVLVGDSRYEEAIEPIKKATELRPGSFEIKTLLGLAYFEAARYQEGIAQLTEADRMQPGNEIVNMYLRVARSRQQNVQRFGEAKKYAEENPKDADVRVGLIELLCYARRADEANPYIEELLRLRPREVRAYQRVGVALGTAGKKDKAMEVFNIANGIQEDPGTHLNLAGMYQKRGESEAALSSYKRVLEMKPDSPVVMVLAAQLLIESGKRREALEMFKRSLAINPTNPYGIMDAAILSAKLDEMDAAKQYLVTLRAIDPRLARKLERFLRLKNH